MSTRYRPTAAETEDKNSSAYNSLHAVPFHMEVKLLHLYRKKESKHYHCEKMPTSEVICTW